MLLESFSLHQMTFSTSLYKFSPCLQFWSIYSSMAHITYSNFSLNTFHLSPVCFSTHTCSVALSQRMSLFLFYTFGFSIVFFIPFFLMGWVLVHITRLEKISPSLFHWTKSYSSDMHTNWNSVLSETATCLLRRTYFWRVFGTKTSDLPPQRN